MAGDASSTNRVDLRRWRTQMGDAVRGWGLAPGALLEASADHWLVLSGAPSPEVNLGLVQSGDPDVLQQVLAVVDRFGAPALLCLTEEVSQEGLPAGWQAAGTMPLMAADLSQVPAAADARVRVATVDDLEATVALQVDAFAMDPAIARVGVEPVLTGVTAEADMRFWLLLEDGVPVSGVLDARTDDVMTLWCMGTSTGHVRRGHARALLAHVIDAARRDGMTRGLLGATPAGRPLYDATGWQPVEEWRLFVTDPAPSAQPA